MCTLSAILESDELLRVAMNRDELDSRPEAHEPRLFSTLTGTAMMPIDPRSEGTWIAVNDAGVVLAMLNVNPSYASAMTGMLSRGRIIPALLDAKNAAAAHEAATRMQFSNFAPFQLVAIDRDAVASTRFDGRSVSRVVRPMDLPVMFTSSGLGDDMVETARRMLFQYMMGSVESGSVAQNAFHRHRWDDCPHLSVNMLRPGARTVSRTVIEVGRHGVDMTYQSTRAMRTSQLSMPLADRQAVLA